MKSHREESGIVSAHDDGPVLLEKCLNPLGDRKDMLQCFSADLPLLYHPTDSELLPLPSRLLVSLRHFLLPPIF